MRRSNILSAPIVSLLAPSETKARRASELLTKISSFQPISVEPTNDALNQLIPFQKWTSIAIQCPQSQTILHWIAPKKDREGMHEMLAIHDGTSVLQAREKLAQSIQKSAYLTMRSVMGAAFTAEHLTGGVPTIEWADHDADIIVTTEEGMLKEITIPVPENAIDADGQTIMTKLMQSSLHRPVTGLYQLTGSNLRLRPLPLATEDRSISPPSFIFHTKSLDPIEKDSEVSTSRIGYSGVGKGQVMVRQIELNGLDIRLCANNRPSSAFWEAQESLLANSTNELESTHVLGGKDKEDPRKENSDCWVEFRAGVKDPVTFWSSSKKPKVAKVPDLPYE